MPLFTTHRVPKEARNWHMAADASSGETIEIGNRNKTGRQGALHPMPRLTPKSKFNTTTTMNCRSQRELTHYSFKPYLTIPVRASTSGRLIRPARSRWPKAMLVPYIEICNNRPQPVPRNNFSSLCRYLQHTQYQRKCDIGKWPRMHRPQKQSKS